MYRDDVILERYGAIYDFGFPYAIKKIDAALIFGPYRNTYFFVGDEYWRYNERYRSMDPGYPKKISSVWRGVPSNLDAAITWKNGLTYFFKGMTFLLIILLIVICYDVNAIPPCKKHESLLLWPKPSVTKGNFNRLLFPV